MPEQIEVRDSRGKLLGYFIPADPGGADDFAETRKLFDPDELKRRKDRARGQRGHTLDEIMDGLQSGEKPE